MILLAGLVLLTTAAHAEPPVLRASLESEPISLDWADTRSSTDRFLVSFLMRGLLKYDARGVPVCDLCKTHTVSPDGKVHRFEIADGVLWSDGKPLEGQHFVDGFKRLLDPAQKLGAASQFAIVASVKAPTPSTLEITLSEPRAVFAHRLTQVASFPIRKEFAGSRGDGGLKLAQGPVLGPYLLAAWEKGKRLVIEGNPEYPNPRPVYRVDFFLGDHATQIERFKAGRIDILGNPTTEDLVGIAGSRVQVSPYWATRLLFFRAQAPSQTANASLRRAVLLSLDRSSIPSLLKNGERAMTGVIPPGLPGYRELPLVSLEPARAREERLRVAPIEKEIRLKLLVRDRPVERKVAEWIGSQLTPLRIKVDMKALGDKEFHRAIERGEFDAALDTWTYTIASPLDLFLHRWGWKDAAYDELVRQLLLEVSPAESARLIDQIGQLLEVKEAAAIPLGYPTLPFLLGKRVVSFAMTPFGDPDLVRIELSGAAPKAATAGEPAKR